MDEIGISITIDETKMIPSLVSDYIEMGPGNVYDVQLSVTETKRIEPPYSSQCRNDYPKTCPSAGAYSMSRCSIGCVKFQIETACNCTEAFVMEGDLEEDFLSMKRFCQDANCVIRHWEALGAKGMTEMVEACTPECHRVQYSV